MSLLTGRELYGCIWEVLPISDEVIEQVEELALKEGQQIVSSNFKYEWADGTIIDDKYDDEEEDEEIDVNPEILPEPTQFEVEDNKVQESQNNVDEDQVEEPIVPIGTNDIASHDDVNPENENDETLHRDMNEGATDQENVEDENEQNSVNSNDEETNDIVHDEVINEINSTEK